MPGVGAGVRVCVCVCVLVVVPFPFPFRFPLICAAVADRGGRAAEATAGVDDIAAANNSIAEQAGGSVKFVDAAPQNYGASTSSLPLCTYVQGSFSKHAYECNAYRLFLQRNGPRPCAIIYYVVFSTPLSFSLGARRAAFLATKGRCAAVPCCALAKRSAREPTPRKATALER